MSQLIEQNPWFIFILREHQYSSCICTWIFPCNCVMKYLTTQNSKFFAQVVVSSQKTHTLQTLKYEINTTILHKNIFTNSILQGLATQGDSLTKIIHFTQNYKKIKQIVIKLDSSHLKIFQVLLKYQLQIKYLLDWIYYNLMVLVHKYLLPIIRYSLKNNGIFKYTAEMIGQKIYTPIKKFVGFPLKYVIIIAVCIPLLIVSAIVGAFVYVKKCKNKKDQKAYIQKVQKVRKTSDSTQASDKKFNPLTSSRICPKNLEQNVCSICLDSNCNTISECGHIFHKKCIKSQIKVHYKCPNCRTFLKMQNLEQLQSL